MLASAAVFVHFFFQAISPTGLSVSSAGVLWWAQRDIERNGAVKANDGRPFSVDVETVLRSVTWHALATVGLVYAHPGAIRVWDLVGLLFGPRDADGSFCRNLLDYAWVPLEQGGFVFPQVRADFWDMQDWVAACRASLLELSAEERELLEPHRAAGGIPWGLLVPQVVDEGATRQRAHREPPPDYAHERLSRQELAELLADSVSHSNWAGTALTEAAPFPQAMLQYYETLNVRRTGWIGSDFKAITQALAAGEIARFDARPLLPQQAIGITSQDITELEGDASDRIPLLSNGCRPTSLRRHARVNAEAMARGAGVAYGLADAQAVSGEPTPDVNASLLASLREAEQQAKAGHCQVAYVHTRRLPSTWRTLWSSLPAKAQETGFQEDILRTESYLWLGPIFGGFHYDEEDNIYVQLTGESDVIMVPQNFTDRLTGGLRRFNLPSRQALAENPAFRDIPVHIFRLRPGDGVTIPGRAFHLFVAQTYDRVALNFFFVPRAGRMEQSRESWYAHERRGENGASPGDSRMALRQLWARSFGRMYEETGKGIIFMGEKNEYI